MLVWILFITAYGFNGVSTQQMTFLDQSSCERVGKRIVQSSKTNDEGGKMSVYVCTQARIVK